MIAPQDEYRLLAEQHYESWGFDVSSLIPDHRKALSRIRIECDMGLHGQIRASQRGEDELMPAAELAFSMITQWPPKSNFYGIDLKDSSENFLYRVISDHGFIAAMINLAIDDCFSDISLDVFSDRVFVAIAKSSILEDTLTERPDLFRAYERSITDLCNGLATELLDYFGCNDLHIEKRGVRYVLAGSGRDFSERGSLQKLLRILLDAQDHVSRQNSISWRKSQ